MNAYLEARDKEGRTVDLRLMPQRYSRPRINLMAENGELMFTFDAEELLRAVKAAWEIVRPYEKP